MRKIRRNMLRAKLGKNKHIQSAWKLKQQRKYGDNYKAVCK